MNHLHHLANMLLGRLVWTSIQTTLLIAIVLLIVRLLPQLPARIRCTLWWLVSLQLVLGLCWQAPLSLPLLAPTADLPVTHIAASAAPFMVHTSVLPDRSKPATSAPAITWRELLPLLWLTTMLAQLPLLAKQWQRTRQLLGTAEPLADASMQALCVQRAQTLGLRRCPPLYVCADIDSPQVSGLRRPVVLLPAVHAMTPAETAMAIAHELAHLRRGDLWLGWLPAIARRLFFFHPLATWAMREYALEREAACDAEVLQQTGTMPQAYARLLLRLGVSHPIHAGLAGASPTFQNLKRRLIMLQHIDPVSRRHLRGWVLVALVAVAGVLPYRVTAASDKQAAAAPSPASPAVAPPLPPIPPMSAPAAPALMPPLPPLAPQPPPPPPPPRNDFSARHVDIDTSDHAANGFALFDGDSVTINGTNADADAARKLHATNQSLLWFRRGNDAYLIRDKALLERASRIYAPVTALARQQGELAGDQAGVAGLQAGLAAQDAAFAQEHAAMAQQQAEKAARVATRAAATSNTDARQSELDAQPRQIDEAQSRLDQRHALEQMQSQFEKKQQAIERKQQQAEQAAAQAMGQLLDEALAKGLAQKTSLR